MCAEKIQRFLMAIVLTLSMVLFSQGLSLYGMILQGFVILMIIGLGNHRFLSIICGYLANSLENVPPNKLFLKNRLVIIASLNQIRNSNEPNQLQRCRCRY